jgi:hypothetical protein
MGAPDKFIFEVHPSRDPLPELIANVWLEFGDILQLIGVNGEIGEKLTPACRFEGILPFSLSDAKQVLPHARKKVRALRPVGSKQAETLPILRRRDPEEIGDRRAQIDVSADGPEALTAGKEARIPENERDIPLFLAYGKAVAALIVRIGKRFAVITCNHDKGIIC